MGLRSLTTPAAMTCARSSLKPDSFGSCNQHRLSEYGEACPTRLVVGRASPARLVVGRASPTRLVVGRASPYSVSACWLQEPKESVLHRLGRADGATVGKRFAQLRRDADQIRCIQKAASKLMKHPIDNCKACPLVSDPSVREMTPLSDPSVHDPPVRLAMTLLASH